MLGWLESVSVLGYSNGVNLSFPNSVLWLLLHTMACIGGIPTLCAGGKDAPQGKCKQWTDSWMF